MNPTRYEFKTPHIDEDFQNLIKYFFKILHPIKDNYHLMFLKYPNYHSLKN